MAVFYANSAGPQGSGDGSSEANACSLTGFTNNDGGTTGDLYQPIAAGDICWVKSGTTMGYDGAVLSSFIQTQVAGSDGNMIKVIGYDSVTGDGGQVTIEDTNPGSVTNSIDLGTNGYWGFANFKIINCRRALATGSGCPSIFVHNFTVLGGAYGVIGIEVNAGTVSTGVISSCYVDGYSSNGIIHSGRSTKTVNCVATNCGVGLVVSQTTYGGAVFNCLAYSNTTGMQIAEETLIANCTCDSNTSHGFNITTSDEVTLFINCVSSNNGGAGVAGPASSTAWAINCMFNPADEPNTSGKTSNITLFEQGEVTGNIGYTDQANGDLSFSSSSAAFNAACSLGGAGYTGSVSYMDLGAVQSQASSSNGGGSSNVKFRVNLKKLGIS